MRPILIGTRGSNLAIKQTEIIRDALKKLYKDSEIDIKVIKTEGDKNMKPIPLDTVGKGWFTKEIEEALLRKEIDLAVHSLKDLPEILPAGLILGGISKRGDIRDALISPSKTALEAMPKGAVIGTDSIRRKIQIMRINPDVVIKSVRGNVNTRLGKLEKGEYDGLILAAVGLERLGMDSFITQYFEPNVLMPAPGQGALAVEIREGDEELKKILEKINDPLTCTLVEAERAFAAGIGGGCKFPIGAYAEYESDELILHGLLGTLDGAEILIDTVKGTKEEATLIGKNLAIGMLDSISFDQIYG